jgi:hypothetical protein
MAELSYNSANSNVRAAIAEAARLTGESEEFLARTAARESSFNPNAKAPTSSATGLFQIIDGTWESLTTKYGAKYGITPQTSRLDPRANAIMGAEYARENRTALQRSLGRAPTDGDLYVAHFMGAGGASALIKAAERDPRGNAAALFPEQAAANPAIFYLDPKTRLRPKELFTVVGDLRAKVGAGDTRVNAPATSPMGAMANTFVESPQGPPKPNAWQLYMMAAEQEQTQMMLGQFAATMGSSEMAPDENFRWTPELIKETTADLPEEYAKYVVENARSRAQVDHYRELAQRDMENEETLGEQGWLANLGYRGAAILTDMPTWLAGGVAGKLVAGAKATKAVMAARAGFIAVAETAPAEIAKMNLRPSYGIDDALIAGTASFAFGAGFGALFGKPGAELDDAFQGAARKAQGDALEADGNALTRAGQAYFRGPSTAQSGGAAATPAGALGQVGDKSALRALDISTMGQLAKSNNPEVRAFAPQLDVDAMGDGGASLRPIESAFEYARMATQATDAMVKRKVNDAFDSWAEARGVPLADRFTGKARDDFMEDVGREIVVPTKSDPNVTAAADAARPGFKRVLDDARESGAEWAKAVPDDPNYFPMVFDAAKIERYTATIGDTGIEQVIARAMMAAQPKLAAELAEKIAARYLKVIKSATDGSTANVSHAISGMDTEALRTLLRETGTPDEDIEAFLAANKSSAKRGPGNFKRRTLMDSETQWPTGEMRRGPSGKMEPVYLSVRDLTDMNFERVWERYNRSINGHIAMVRQGFQTQGAFETHIRRITIENANSFPGYTANHAKEDYKRLRFLGDSVYGIPTHNMDEKWQQATGILSDWNFSRSMGQSGVAQLGDMPKLIHKVGFKAAFSEFRLGDIIDVFRTGNRSIRDKLVADLEDFTGVGTHRTRQTIVAAYKGIDEFYAESQTMGTLSRVRQVTRTMANVTGLVSGMTPSVDFLGRWATRAFTRELAALTKGTRKLSAKLMNDRGLTPELLERFGKLVDQMDIDPRGTILDMNLDKLKALDPEGYTQMRLYVSRQARLTVLEHSPGMLPMWAQSPLGRLAVQFRTFSIASHAANTLHNIKLGPAYAAQSLLLTSVWAGMIYALHQYTKSIGRPDQDEYLQKTFAPDKFLASALGRSADAGLLPMMTDSTVFWLLNKTTGMESPFQYSRTTGLSTGIMGNPTIDLINDLTTGAGELVADPLQKGKVFTKEDAKRLQSLLPLNNTYGVANAMAAITGRLPKKEPDDTFGNR